MRSEVDCSSGSIHYRLKNICELTDYVENLATNSSNHMYDFICIQIVSGRLYVVIKLNVPLEAIEIEIDTACNFLFPRPVPLSLRLCLPSVSFLLILCLSLSFLNQRKHTLIVGINLRSSAVIMFWPRSTDESHHRSGPRRRS